MTDVPQFVHLHVHSEYSLLDGSVKIKKLIKETLRRKDFAIALTDHDALHGALEFYLACQAEGIQPIIGYEVNLEPLYLEDKKQNTHLVLLAENEIGYGNLLKLCTIANTVGKNRLYSDSTTVLYAELKQHAQGLICLTSCLLGELSALLTNENTILAYEYIEKLTLIFSKDNLYIELIDNGLTEQKKVIPKLAALAAEKGLPIVATADVHYLDPKDKETHLSLLAIKHKLQRSDIKSMPDGVSFHMPSTEEMQEKFALYPKALQNTVAIAKRCQLKIDTKSVFMPNYTEREGESANECLVRLSRQGLANRKSAVMLWMGDRFNPQVWQDYEERLEYELSVITTMNFAGYFLIVQDFINWAKKENIPVGPGRGSAAGSLVTYALQITNIDPLRFNLLFERFLNPERISMPDIDTDFCQDRRSDVLKYVYQKYGHGAVSQIVTFGRMMARNALKNLARINRWSFKDSNEFAKLIPESPGMTLEQAFAEEPKIQERLQSDERAKTLWDGALEIEGTLSSLGIHAAGVIISDRSLDERCPLLESEGQLLTQFEHKYAEKVGLIKFDFLGLKTLTVIDNTIRIIKKYETVNIDLDSLDVDDPKVYQMISTANVTGIFQLESMGMRKLIADLKPTCFTDIIAVLALFRPGPLGSGMVEDFVKRKHGQTPVVYPFKELEHILSDTYGVIVYQEQVQKIAAVLASYSLGEADLLRRAMGKKDRQEMERQKNRFVAGATKNNHAAKAAEELFDLMAKFAEYGFNKSHTAAYGWVTFQTAWLKTYYPTEFMSAIMTCDLDNTEKISIYVQDCKRMKIEILPPCVNHSFYEFSIPKKNQIQFGLGAIKGIGSGIIQSIMKERDKSGPFHTVPEFIARVDPRKLNKKIMESLIKAGAFDTLASNRHELMENVTQWIKSITKEQERSDQVGYGLFDIVPKKNNIKENFEKKTSATHHKIVPYYDPYKKETILISDKVSLEIQNLLLSIQYKKTLAWSFDHQLEGEMGTLGFYISGHPADKYRQDIKNLASISLDEAPLHAEGVSIPDFKRKSLKIAGIVTMILEKRNKEGQPFAVMKLEDGTSSLEVTLFHKQYISLAEPLQLGDALVVECKLKPGIEEGIVRGIVQSLEKISRKREELVKKITISTKEEFIKNTQDLMEFYKIINTQPGNIPLFFEIIFEKENFKLKALFKNHKIRASEELIEKIMNFRPGLVFIECAYHNYRV